ncbi:MAG: hypothetical protein BMS9Abin29_1004 [Gemmatimonadota bacterium]|nr:MAG: hypothetical protein BMS9Abin29_1004 [Gemmatimonadota bacterium]
MRTWPTLIALAVLTGVGGGPAAAQAGRTEVEEGNRLYEEGRFGEAHAKYLEALRRAPGTDLIRFNDGNALYMSEEFQRALDAYRAAIESGDPALAGPAWYNVGNALYRQQQLPEALEAYKQALRVSPGDIDAKHNLERVLEKMKQQEQEKGEGEDQDQDQQQEQDQQKDGEQDQDQDQKQDENQDQNEESPPQAEPQQASGRMSPEEAQRLLQAIQEDPSEVNRRPPASLRGRKPRKAW